MTADNIRITVTNGNFLRQLYEKRVELIEEQKEVFEQEVEEAQKSVAPSSEVFDQYAIQRRIAEANIKIRQAGEPPLPRSSWGIWRWLIIFWWLLLFSSLIITSCNAWQNTFVAHARDLPTLQDELDKVPQLFIKLGNLSKRSESLSASYLSQAFSSLAEEKRQREFLKTEANVNTLFQPNIKPGPSQLLLLNSYPIAQDRLPLGNNDLILPDGLWLQQKTIINQQTAEVMVATEENLAVEIVPTEEPAAVVEAVVVNESREEEPIVQNSDVSPTTGTFIWPTSGPISQGAHRYHMALDIAVPSGTPILAMDGGIVEQVGWDNTGYGNLIVVDHQNGYKTYYAHLSSFAVQAGAIVNQGSLIGEVGSTGNSTGPHLHFEIRLNNILQNPFNFLY